MNRILTLLYMNILQHCKLITFKHSRHYFCDDWSWSTDSWYISSSLTPTHRQHEHIRSTQYAFVQHLSTYSQSTIQYTQYCLESRWQCRHFKVTFCCVTKSCDARMMVRSTVNSLSFRGAYRNTQPVVERWFRGKIAAMSSPYRHKKTHINLHYFLGYIRTHTLVIMI